MHTRLILVYLSRKKNAIGLTFFLMLLASFTATASSYEKEIENIESLKTSKAKFDLCQELSTRYIYTDSEKSLNFARYGFQLAEKEKNDSKKAKYLTLLARNHKMLGLTELALDELRIAEVLSKKEKYYENLAVIYHLRCVIYNHLKMFNAFEKELDKYEALVNSESLEALRFELDIMKSNYCVRTNKPEQANLILQNLIHKNLADDKDKNLVYIHLGDVKRLQKDLDSALYYYKLAYNVSISREEFNSNLGAFYHTDAALSLGSIYGMSGDIKNSVLLLKEALELSRKHKYAFKEANALKTLSFLYEQIEDYKKAYEYSVQYSNVSLESNQKRLALSMEESYLVTELEKKKSKSLSSKNKDLSATNVVYKSQNNLYLFCLIFFPIILLLGAVIFIVYRKNRRQKLKNLELKAKMVLHRKELKQKMSQLSSIFEVTQDISSTVYLLKEDNPSSPFLKEVYEKLNVVRGKMLREDDWNDFIKTFRKAYPKFETQLVELHPTVTQKEVRMSVYLKAGLTQHEISSLRDISLEGVKSACKRLKKKLEIPTEQKITDYFLDI